MKGAGAVGQEHAELTGVAAGRGHEIAPAVARDVADRDRLAVRGVGCAEGVRSGATQDAVRGAEPHLHKSRSLARNGAGEHEQVARAVVVRVGGQDLRDLEARQVRRGRGEAPRRAQRNPKRLQIVVGIPLPRDEVEESVPVDVAEDLPTLVVPVGRPRRLLAGEGACAAGANGLLANPRLASDARRASVIAGATVPRVRLQIHARGEGIGSAGRLLPGAGAVGGGLVFVGRRGGPRVEQATAAAPEDEDGHRKRVTEVLAGSHVVLIARRGRSFQLIRRANRRPRRVARPTRSASRCRPLLGCWIGSSRSRRERAAGGARSPRDAPGPSGGRRGARR